MSGLSWLHKIVSRQRFVLQVDMESTEREKKWALYLNFQLDGHDKDFKITLQEAYGTAGINNIFSL